MNWSNTWLNYIIITKLLTTNLFAFIQENYFIKQIKNLVLQALVITTHISILLKREFTAIHCLHVKKSKALPSQLPSSVVLCPPDGTVAPDDRAGERWELEFLDVVEAELHSDHSGTFCRSPWNRASSSSSTKGNTRCSHGVWGCWRTEGI